MIYRKKIVLIFFFTFILMIQHSQNILLSQINVPITIKNSTSSIIENFPVTFVVPLPRGEYQSTNNLMFTDGSVNMGQIDILNRHWATDNSISHLLITTLVNVPANGSEIYYLTNGPSNISTTMILDNLNNQIIINTGKIKVYINKQNFSLFDKVYYDENGDNVYTESEKILESDSSNGGILTFWNNTFQKSSDPNLYTPEVFVEENGPLRAIIRFETYTNSISSDQLYHGYQVRFYFYAGCEYIKVEYTIKNSDYKTSVPRVLYFKDFSLYSKLAFTPTELKFGTETGVYQTTVGSGKYMYQNFHNQFTINDNSGITLYSGTKSKGWFDISDNSHGITAVVRDFWQTWPGALEINNQNQLRVGLWPRFGKDWWWESFDNGNKTYTSTDFYWLEDLQEVTKEIWYIFHGGSQGVSNIEGKVNAINLPPVGVVPLNWYKVTKVTLDLGGYIPLNSPLQATGTFQDYLGGSENWNDTHYIYGWFNYADDVDRRMSCATGGWPYSAARFLMTENPVFYHVMRAKVEGELNSRPQWLSGFIFDRDQSTANLLFGYCWSSWRLNDNSNYLTGTENHGWLPRDFQHGWWYDIAEHYFFSGSLRIKDWYSWMGEAVKFPLNYLPSIGNIRETREIGHALATLIGSYRITGKPEFLETAKTCIDYLRINQQSFNGTWRVQDENDPNQFESPLQVGFLTRAIIDYLKVLGDSDPQAEVDAWGVLQGLMEWNLYLAQFCYKWPQDAGSYSGSGVTLVDPESWFYLHTGISEYKAQLVDYIYNGAYGNPQQWGWDGDNVYGPDGAFVGRISAYMLNNPKSDTIPPPQINDLRVSILGTNVKLEWTSPQSANKYHIRWSLKPISQNFTRDKTKNNFWAARGVGNNIVPSPGLMENIIISNLPRDRIIYFGVISFDENNNMSEVSNIANIFNSLNPNRPSPPTGVSINP